MSGGVDAFTARLHRIPPAYLRSTPSLLTGNRHPKGRYFSSLTSSSESAEALEAVSFESKFATSSSSVACA